MHPANTDYDSIYFKPYNASYDSAIAGTPFRKSWHQANTTYSDPATGDYIVRYTTALKAGYHLGIGLDHDLIIPCLEDKLRKNCLMAILHLDLFNGIKGMHYYASDDWNTK